MPRERFREQTRGQESASFLVAATAMASTSFAVASSSNSVSQSSLSLCSKRRQHDGMSDSAKSNQKRCRTCAVESKPYVKRAGSFLLGPRLGNSPVTSIVQCLARKDGTDEFYSVKLLTLEERGRETQDGRQGKMLLHTEYSLLSLLHDQDGVVHHHGLFQDEVLMEDQADHHQDKNKSSSTAKATQKRLCLVLDCLCAHDYSNVTADLINLQHYVIREKKLSEREAVIIFHDIVRVVENLHEVSFAIFNRIVMHQSVPTSPPPLMTAPGVLHPLFGLGTGIFTI